MIQVLICRLCEKKLVNYCPQNTLPKNKSDRMLIICCPELVRLLRFQRNSLHLQTSQYPRTLLLVLNETVKVDML